MDSILDFLTGRHKRETEAQSAIYQLSQEKKPVQVEIESTPARFYSRILLRSGAVVLTYPQDLEKYLKEDGRVRIRPDSPDGRELRLVISSLHYGGSGPMAANLGQMTLICKIPGASFEKGKRSSDRWRTSQFRDLLLEMPSLPSPLPILDLSPRGLKIRVAKEEDLERFPIGVKRHHGTIHLGKKASVTVLDLTPRRHQGDWVGMEMTVDREDNSDKVLGAFLESLRREELQTSS